MVDGDAGSRRSTPARVVGDLLASVGKSLVRLAAMFLIAFAIGTGAASIVCLYYGIPLAFALIGGFAVLGLAVALSSDGLIL